MKRVIGEGGSGYVLDVSSRDGTRVAAKYMRAASLTTDRRRRFKNGIHFCYLAQHLQIIKVIDHGVIESDGSPFYVMPLYAKTLRQIFNNSKVDAKKRFQVLIDVLTGVEATHLLGVAHRDLKPENILISEDESQVVIADFGIACFIEAEMAIDVETRDASRLANFKYAAPEQLKHGALGTKQSDILSLGLMLNEAFTGKVARGSEYRKIGANPKEYAYLDEIVESMIRQETDTRILSVGLVKHSPPAGADVIAIEHVKAAKLYVQGKGQAVDNIEYIVNYFQKGGRFYTNYVDRHEI